MDPKALTALALASLAVVACGRKTSNAIDPSLESASVPVRVEHVRMRETLATGIGAGPVSLSSADRPNAIAVAFDVVPTAAVPAHAGVSARLVCAVDGLALASPMAFDANRRLERAAIGDRLEQSEVMRPGPFVRTIPQTCEVRFAFTVVPPLPPGPSRGPAPEVTPFATVCFADDVLRDGPCTDDELPRTPTAPDGIDTVIDAALVERGEGHVDLEVRARVTVGETPPAPASVRVLGTCMQGGEAQALPLLMWLPLSGLQPGESIAQGATAATNRDGGPAPQPCTIEALLERDGGLREPLARWCVRPDSTHAGACEEH